MKDKSYFLIPNNMPSQETQTSPEEEPDDHEVSSVRSCQIPLDQADPEIRQIAEESGQPAQAVHEQAIIVGNPDEPKTLYYRTMGLVHGVDDLTEEEALALAEEARRVAEVMKS
jgi:hypothetical protein